MALVSRARGTFYGQRTGGAPHRRAVFIGFGPLAGGAAGARERSLKSSHFVAPLCWSSEQPRRVYRNLSDGVGFSSPANWPFALMGSRTGVCSSSIAIAQGSPGTDGNRARATERPDPPAVRLRADAERRPLPEGLRRAWRLDEDQSTDRPVAFDAGLAELPFDDKTGGVRPLASPAHLGTFGKAGEHGMIRRINQYRQWGWRLRLVANHAGFKGT